MISVNRHQTLALLALILSVSSACSQTKPADPYYCAVEVGSRGVKARLFSFASVEDKDLPTVDALYAKDINTNIVASMDGGQFSRKGIDETVDAVASMLEEMRASQPTCKALVVGSSGVSKASNREDLARAVIDRAKVPDMPFITPEQEAKFGFMGSVPRGMWETTAFVDVGSGNTKYGVMVGKDFKSFDIPYGAVSLSKKAATGGADFIAAVNAVVDAELRPAFRIAASQLPALLNRSNVVMIGGTAWSTATFVSPDKVSRRFVKMSKGDLADFRKALEDQTWAKATPSLFALPKTRKAFATESAKVLDTFSRDNLVAGHAMIKLLMDDRGQDGPIYFARYGNWIYGYVQEKYAADLWGSGGIEEHL